MIRHEEVHLLSEMVADKQGKMKRVKAAEASQALVETLIQDGRLVAQDETNNTLDVEQVRADDQKRFAAKIARIEALKAEHLDATVRKLLFGYEMRCYWFELYECVRKLLLIGLPVFLYEYPTVQVTLYVPAV
jgi:hypothetical protein